MSEHDDWGRGECAACGRQIQPGHLLCWRHWTALAPATRRRLTRALAEYRERMDGPTREALRAAQAAAVEEAQAADDELAARCAGRRKA